VGVPLPPLRSHRVAVRIFTRAEQVINDCQVGSITTDARSGADCVILATRRKRPPAGCAAFIGQLDAEKLAV